MASSKRTVDLLSTGPLQGQHSPPPWLHRPVLATARCAPRRVSRELDWLGAAGQAGTLLWDAAAAL